MIVDTSAFLAILLKEADADRFLTQLLDAERIRVSAATVVELYIVAIGRTGVGGAQDVEQMLVRFDADIIPVHTNQMEIARDAFLTFGKGRHPAKLNFGDCFSYALAKAYREPLLYKGNDFAQTDIACAL
jgi:ribonuclease VapC